MKPIKKSDSDNCCGKPLKVVRLKRKKIIIKKIVKKLK